MASFDGNNNRQEIMVSYEVHDIETGKTYVSLVPESDVGRLDKDPIMRFRLLNSLKENHVNPVSTWLEVEVSHVSQDAVPRGSVWEPSLPKSSQTKKPSGKTPLWGDENTRKFLNAALPFRKDLRKFRVSQDVYEKIAKVLNKQIEGEHSPYDNSQLRQKVKTLKQTYGEAKQGKHKGDRWTHYWLMYYLYDEEIGLSTSIALDNDQKRNSVLPTKTPPQALGISNGMHPLLSSTFHSFNGEQQLNNGEVLSPILESSTPIFIAEDGNFNAEEIDIGEEEPDTNGNLENELEVTVEKVNNILRSPSKKKAKTPSAADGIRNSPVGTPKRKRPKKAALLWPPDKVNQFLSECKKRKQDVLQERSHPDVWRGISQNLNMTDEGAWQMCRDKFAQLNRYFIDTILPGKGYLGTFIWAYYEDFCELHDIASDYHEVISDLYEMEDDEDEENGTQSKWDDDSTKLLIDLVKAKSHQFQSSFFKAPYLYSLIALKFQEFRLKFSGKRCQKKMEVLRHEYRIEFDKTRGTGAAPSSWAFYDKMNELDGGKPNMIAPVTSSAGRGLIYTEGGVKKKSTEARATRTCPPPDQKPKTVKTAKAAVYTPKAPRQQQLNERSVEARERLAHAVDRLTLNMETAGGQRMAYLNRLELKVDKLLQMGK